MIEQLSQAMIAIGFALMVVNVIKVGRFVRHQHDILTGEGTVWLGYVILAFTICFALIYALIFFQNFAEPSIGIILLGGSAFVYVVLWWIFQLVASIKTNTRSMVEALSSVIDARDRDLRGHSRHVELISSLIYKALPEDERETINQTNLQYAAIFHDLGKLGVPESVLNKTGRLSRDDWAMIRRHPRIGADILQSVHSFDEIEDWIAYHHERIDGKGYYSIPGDQIPLGARIISVADVFSAVLMRRPYKEATSYDECIEILKDAAGTQLDAHLVEVFCSIPRDKIMACSYVLGDNAGDI